MAGVKIVRKALTRQTGFGRGQTAVPMPHLKGAHSLSKIKDKRIYKKSVLLEDPSQFNNVGFGQTGMDGED
jgi:hypothetical protein